MLILSISERERRRRKWWRERRKRKLGRKGNKEGRESFVEKNISQIHFIRCTF